MLVGKPSYRKLRSIAVVQFVSEGVNSFKYISFSKALESGEIIITEVNSSGSVNDLMIENKSDNFVFFSDGDLLQGAKQNRVLNTSVLVMPHTKIIVPVSCVEAGRWRYTSKDFQDSGYSAPHTLRQAIHEDVISNLRLSKQHRSDQSRVWNQVSIMERFHNESSPSSDMLNTYEKKRYVFDKNLNDVFPEAGMNSVAIFKGGKLASVESFNSSEIYAEYFPKLIRAAMMDIDYVDDEQGIDEQGAISELEYFAESVKDLSFEKHKAVAAGDEKRFRNEKLSCFELNYEGNQIHFAALLNTEETRDLIYRDSRGMLVINFGDLKGRRFREILRMDYDYAMRIMMDPKLSDSMKRELFEEALRFGGRH